MTEHQTLDEWIAWSKANEQERGNGKDTAPAASIKLALQAAVQAENLTGDKHWDYYLQCLQAAIEDSKKAEHTLVERLSDLRLVDHNTILGLKMALTDARATIRTLEWAVELPRDIKDTGKAAKGLEVPAPK